MPLPEMHGRTHCPTGSDPIPAACLLPTYPWARRYNWDESDQAMPSGSEENVALADFARMPNDATCFTAHDFGTQDGIQTEKNGLYSITFRAYWSQYPGAHLVTFYGVDPDAGSGYTFHANALQHTLNVSGSIILRLAAGQEIYMSIYHEFGSSRNLEGLGGTFFEMAFLGSTDVSEPRSWGSP